MTGSSRKDHWESVYSSRAADQVSWFQAEPRLSLELIDTVAPPAGLRILDVGGGASVLVDRLLERPFREVAVLDISGTALERARARLGPRADRVRWIEADVTAALDLDPVDIWHDRAVFHFLTDPADRAAYVALARRSIVSGGHLIISTFADDGPTRCSNLDVCRYNAVTLTAVLGEGFTPIRDGHEVHTTPWGSPQAFHYGVFARQ